MKRTREQEDLDRDKRRKAEDESLRIVREVEDMAMDQEGPEEAGQAGDQAGIKQGATVDEEAGVGGEAWNQLMLEFAQVR